MTGEDERALMRKAMLVAACGCTGVCLGLAGLIAAALAAWNGG